MQSLTEIVTTVCSLYLQYKPQVDSMGDEADVSNKEKLPTLTDTVLKFGIDVYLESGEGFTIISILFFMQKSVSFFLYAVIFNRSDHCL